MYTKKLQERQLWAGVRNCSHPHGSVVIPYQEVVWNGRNTI